MPHGPAADNCSQRNRTANLIACPNCTHRRNVAHVEVEEGHESHAGEEALHGLARLGEVVVAHRRGDQLVLGVGVLE
jgi:hypothetical protein